jgi:hypothetical protein
MIHNFTKTIYLFCINKEKERMKMYVWGILLQCACARAVHYSHDQRGGVLHLSWTR